MSPNSILFALPKYGSKIYLFAVGIAKAT